MMMLIGRPTVFSLFVELNYRIGHFGRLLCHLHPEEGNCWAATVLADDAMGPTIGQDHSHGDAPSYETSNK